MTTRNDLALVRHVLSLLGDQGVRTWIFGGWAEELRRIALPREHKDIDLLFPARNFSGVDFVVKTNCLNEIVAKRLPHKRAFVLDGVLVELILVQRDERGLHTDFWGRLHEWPLDPLGNVDDLPVASVAALSGYRCAYDVLRMRAA